MIDWNHFDLYKFMLSLGSILLLWAVFLVLLGKLKKKYSFFATHTIRGLNSIIHLFFFYFFIKLCLTDLPIPQTWETYGGMVVRVLFTLGVTNLCVKISKQFIDHSTKLEDDYGQASSIIKNLSTIMIWILGITLILNSIGVALTPIIAALGVGGIAVALAVQAPLGNFFAGLQLLSTKQVRIGDFIQIASGEEGTVQDISWRTVVIKTRGETTVIIPNSEFSASIITNKSWPITPYYTGISLQIDPSEDLNRVQKIALEVAQKASCKISRKEELLPEAVARFSTYTDIGVTLNISVVAGDYTEISPLNDLLVRSISDRFKEENIKIAFRTFPGH